MQMSTCHFLLTNLTAQATKQVTNPLLDALDASYDAPCQGTGFFALQSCVNSDCDPNVAPIKEDADVDGRCVLVARRDIREGEELIDVKGAFEGRLDFMHRVVNSYADVPLVDLASSGGDVSGAAAVSVGFAAREPGGEFCIPPERPASPPPRSAASMAASSFRSNASSSMDAG